MQQHWRVRMRALGGTASGDAIAAVRAAVSVIGCRVVPDMRAVAQCANCTSSRAFEK